MRIRIKIGNSFSLREGSFRLQLNLNINENLKIFMIKFPKFNNLYETFLRKKKKKCGNPKGT